MDRQLPKWSMPLAGDRFNVRLITDSRGRVIVSTTKRVEARAPGGLTYGETSIALPGATTYVNYHALRAHVLEPDGRTAWVADKVHILSEAPDGRLVATNDRRDFILLDPSNGRTVESREMPDRGWSLIGRQDHTPITTTFEGAVWVAPFIYTVFDHHLHRFDEAGNLLARHALAREPFDAHLRQRPDLGALPSAFTFPSRLALAYHPKLESLIASSPTILGWTMRLRLDGVIEWLALPCDACCNSASFVGDTGIVHTSSCGSRLSFLSSDGALIAAHEVHNSSGHSFNDGQGSVYTLGDRSIRAFDERGELTWRLDVPEVIAATVANRVVYALSPSTKDKLTLGAFEIDS